MNKFLTAALVCGLAAGFASCSSDDPETPAPNPGNSDKAYAMCLGITGSDGTTVYYAVTDTTLMEGTISAKNNGIEQSGYRDFEKFGNMIYSIGGLGVTNCNGLMLGQDGKLQQVGSFQFTSTIAAMAGIDDNTSVALELPKDSKSGDKLTFYVLDNKTAAITRKVTDTPVKPLADLTWPTVTGMQYQSGNIYVSYFPMDPTTFATDYMDTTFVAVYSYPDMKFVKLMKDTRMGPAGSWNAYNGLLKTETGDIYVMTNSSMSNGFSQAGTKHSGFVCIPAGQTEFDPTYSFDVEAATVGLKMAHVAYIGKGLVYAEISAINPQTADDRWGDKKLKSCIIDLNKKTVTDVQGIPVHDGNGGRRFNVLVADGYVYAPIVSSEGHYIYRINPYTAKADRGAKIEATFVGGTFSLK